MKYAGWLIFLVMLLVIVGDEAGATGTPKLIHGRDVEVTEH
jgi:hypothetical protein